MTATQNYIKISLYYRKWLDVFLDEIHQKHAILPENSETFLIKKTISLKGKGAVEIGVLYHKCRFCGKLFLEVSKFKEHWRSHIELDSNQQLQDGMETNEDLDTGQKMWSLDRLIIFMHCVCLF